MCGCSGRQGEGIGPACIAGSCGALQSGWGRSPTSLNVGRTFEPDNHPTSWPHCRAFIYTPTFSTVAALIFRVCASCRDTYDGFCVRSIAVQALKNAVTDGDGDEVGLR